MATKKDYTLLYVAGAGALAYLILKKSSPRSLPVIPVQTSSVLPANIFSEFSGALKNILAPSAPVTPSVSLPPVDLPSAPSPSAGYTTLPTIAPPAPIAPAPDVQPIYDPSGDILNSVAMLDQESIAGFNEIPGTALAVICGCAACMPPLKAIGKFDWTSLIIPGAVIAGGYLLIKNLGLLGGSSSVNNTAIAQQTQTANQNSLNSAVNQGSQTTLSDAQYQSIANDIYGQGVTFTGLVSSRAQDQIVSDLMQMKTIADLYKLKIAFGVKELPTSFWSTCQWLNFNCTAMDLDTFVKLCLDADHLTAINNYFSAGSINYKF